MASWIRSRSSRSPRLALALAATLLTLGPAASPAFAAGKAADPAAESAKAEFKRGQTSYTLGRFSEALAAYSKAYELKPLAPFLFNIAQCHRQLADYERAVFFYRRYLDSAPKGDKNAAVVNGLLEDSEKRLTEQKSRADADAQARRQADLEKARADAARAETKAAESRRAELEAKTAAEAASQNPPAVGGLTSSAETAPAPTATAATPVYQQWWLWTVVGVVVVGAAAGTAAYVATEPKAASTSLGTLDAR
ncbi:MAG TPA: hypothetical protein VGK67_09620 [Myxococcales bacterium]|jgi:tetratricopeptide (TPR) repeat protein